MDWLEKMNSAIDYIENNLTEEIDFNIVAMKACCSSYNFQRMFSFITDIPLAEYIRRRRLTQAVMELQNTDMKILDIAVKYRYNSSTSFTRAFASLYGITPTEAKQAGATLKVYPKFSFGNPAIKFFTDNNVETINIKGKIFVNARAIIERTQNNKKEIIVQRRVQEGLECCWELPGGCIEPYESLYDALRREIKQETGLDVISVSGEDGYFQDIGNSGNLVECVKPFSVYQTLEGYVDSVGFHFICHATGEPLSEGRFTKDIKWICFDELEKLVNDNDFSNIDKGAVMLYLKNNF